MTDWVRQVLERYGQDVTVDTADGERTVRAFLQPMTERDERARSDVTSIGWVDGRLWLYLGQTALEEGLRRYFRDLIDAKYTPIYYKPAEDVSYTLIYNRVVAILLNIPGVENFTSLTVNGGTADVTIQAGQIPVAGEVSVT